MLMPKFDAQAAVDHARYFVDKAGGRISHLKLMKLLYLVERRALRELNRFVSYATPVSMEKGPVLSEVYNLMLGRGNPQEQALWNATLSRVNNRLIHAVGEATPRKTTKATRQIMDTIWDRFGSLKSGRLVELTHKFCPEWEDVGKSSKPIDIESLIRTVTSQPEIVIAQMANTRAIDDVWDSIKL